MDAELNLSTAPFRDPRYAPRRLDVVERPGGEYVLTNPTPFSDAFQTRGDTQCHLARPFIEGERRDEALDRISRSRSPQPSAYSYMGLSAPLPPR